MKPNDPKLKIILGLWPLIVEKLKAHPDYENAAVDGIMAGLMANTNVWSKDKETWEQRPDGKTRMETIKLLLAYDEGLPLQRIQQAILTNGGMADMHEIKQAVASSPAMLSGLKRMLEDIETAKKPDPKRIELEPKK